MLPPIKILNSHFSILNLYSYLCTQKLINYLENMKIGDKVRFLSEVGGGRVSGFQGKDIVLVEDEDGFNVPMRTSEVVVIGEEDYDTRHVVELKAPSSATKGAMIDPTHKVKEVPSGTVEEASRAKTSPVERKGGDLLSAYLAFVPIDVKELSQTRFETYIVNDSNYYLRYTYLSVEGTGWRLRATGEVEPNTKEFIEEFGRESLNGMERVCVQLLAYKRNKNFLMKPVTDVQLRIDGVKFYKLHTFQENNFFEQPAQIYTIIENDRAARSLVLDARQMKEILNNTRI